jgi:hypothetical protein
MNDRICLLTLILLGLIIAVGLVAFAGHLSGAHHQNEEAR